MMGHRAKLNGDEWDMFSRRARKIVCIGRGQIHKAKKAFARRMRRKSNEEIREYGEH